MTGLHHDPHDSPGLLHSPDHILEIIRVLRGQMPAPECPEFIGDSRHMPQDIYFGEIPVQILKEIRRLCFDIRIFLKNPAKVAGCHLDVPL